MHEISASFLPGIRMLCCPFSNAAMSHCLILTTTSRTAVPVGMSPCKQRQRFCPLPVVHAISIPHNACPKAVWPVLLFCLKTFCIQMSQKRALELESRFFAAHLAASVVNPVGLISNFYQVRLRKTDQPTTPILWGIHQIMQMTTSTVQGPNKVLRVLSPPCWGSREGRFLMRPPLLSSLTVTIPFGVHSFLPPVGPAKCL